MVQKHGLLQPTAEVWLIGATPHPRSGAAMESARGSQKELPQVQGQGQWPRGAITCLRPGVAAQMSYFTLEVRGGGREELPHVQGAANVWVQEG